MKGGLKMKVQGSKTRKAAPAAEYKEIGNQKGSLLLEAIVVLGMIATFTPMLYKHVADRRADIENINRANTLLYLQHKAEDYLKDPDNITALVEELGHNQHKEIYPSEMGAGSNFDGRYIVGIRREDENNKPVLKAMIIDTVHTGSDLRAAKVAELIGISAGIYTAVDPDAAWGINGIWSEPLSRYFDTTNIPTGAVAITTEYNKAKYRVNISDILVDADLDMGEFEVTAEQINAVAIAAQNGTLDQLIAQDVNAATKVTSPKLVATEKLCVGGEDAENCIESWEGLGGGGGDTSDLTLVQLCNAGMSESCMAAFAKDLNTSCSKVDAVYDRFGAAYPTPKIYSLSYGSGENYEGTVRTKCEGTQFVVDNISTPNLSNPVEQVGDTAFGITTPGWYQITLKGEAGCLPSDSSGQDNASGGILIANTYYNTNTLITLKGVAGHDRSSASDGWSGAGVALWDTMDTTGAPTLVAGGGARFGAGGYIGGTGWQTSTSGYSWDGTLGNSTYCCYTAPCNNGATGGCYVTKDSSSWKAKGGTGTGSSGYPCPSGYICTTITGGSIKHSSFSGTVTYPAGSYGNGYRDVSSDHAYGYASIRWCGPSGSASTCPDACSTDSDCDSDMSCRNGFCSDTPRDGTVMYEVNNISTATLSSNVAQVGTYTIPVAGKYQITLMGEAGSWNSYSTQYPGNGGIIIANMDLVTDTILVLKGVRGGYHNTTIFGGAGVCMWSKQTVSSSETLQLCAGGGGVNAYWTGGGYLGGYQRSNHSYDATKLGYNYDGTQASASISNDVYCASATNCPIGAYGGTGFTWGGGGAWWLSFGGAGYCAGELTCNMVAGGNSCWTTDSHAPKYHMTTEGYGNGGAGYVAITYCGPNANSTCP